MSALLIRGTTYLNRLDSNGLPTGMKKILGVSSLSIKTAADIREQLSKDKNTYGQITAAVAVPKPTEVAWSIQDFDSNSLAMALMGNSAILSSGGGTATAESIASAQGIFVPLAHRNITAASVVVTNVGATMTYVENTDYEINYAMGMICALVGGAITAAESLNVTYAYGAISGWSVAGGTVPQIQGELRLEGVNMVDNTRCILTLDQVLLTSATDLDFMADKYPEFKMTGRAQLLPGKTSAFRYETF